MSTYTEPAAARVAADAQSAATASSKTLDAGIGLLEALRDHPDGMTVTELARATGLQRNAVSRHLTALGRHRLVSRNNNRYVLGLGIVELNAAVRPQLRLAATAELQALADNCQATAFITALDTEDEAVVVSVVEPRMSTIHVAYRAGKRHPLDLGASGIAILAGRPYREGEREVVTRARSDGYSVTTGELQTGAWGVAAPIQAGRQPAEASVGVVTIGQQDEATVAARVLAAAAEIAKLL